MPVTSHLTDADKDVLGEALLKSVLAPADEEKPLEVHLTAPPADLRPGSPQRTSALCSHVGVGVLGRPARHGVLYEKRRCAQNDFHAESRLSLHARSAGKSMDETWFKSADVSFLHGGKR